MPVLSILSNRIIFTLLVDLGSMKVFVASFMCCIEWCLMSLCNVQDVYFLLTCFIAQYRTGTVSFINKQSPFKLHEHPNPLADKEFDNFIRTVNCQSHIVAFGTVSFMIICVLFQ